ncbi:MAG: META domain-containing protein [Chloroflexi bacterium]|nr:META domain-containing protein [Chloroflexota bacterium]
MVLSFGLRRSRAVAILSGLLAVVIIGLSSGPTPLEAAPQSSLTSSEGLIWQLRSYTDRQNNRVVVLPQSEITIGFLDSGTLGGYAGCNWYAGLYETHEQDLRLLEGYTTRRACGAALDQQESNYYSALWRATRYVLTGDTLDLFDSTGTLLASFVALPSDTRPR